MKGLPICDHIRLSASADSAKADYFEITPAAINVLQRQMHCSSSSEGKDETSLLRGSDHLRPGAVFVPVRRPGSTKDPTGPDSWTCATSNARRNRSSPPAEGTASFLPA
ncbi:uncharacterized protein LOC106663967 [Cimex lectularius]|uniref:Uncharacterized protein n=1 Tax=Cimex lectularius TaxID=79782 RepID=A0A8I6RGT8_CIMLE|nr:uncharacterized protein LOC106663967 [Cimex lectularius]